MPGLFSRSALLLSLACWALAAHAGDPAPTVVRTEAQLKAALASGQPTPLDALTPYGKRRFIRKMQWSERGLGGLFTTDLIRELDGAQIAAVMAFVDSSDYSPARGRDLSTPPLRLPDPSADVERRQIQLDQFYSEEADRRRHAADPTTTTDRAALERRYLELFGERMNPAALQKQPIGDLPVLFDAALRAKEEAHGGVASAHLRQVYDELRRRGVDTRRTMDETILGELLAAREFAQAKAFAASKPNLAQKTIPTVHDSLGIGFAGRSVYRYNAAAKSLTREALPYPKGVELVMIVDAGCGFSTNALAALQSDADLRQRLLKANLTLITPPRSAISFGFVEHWNAENPSIPMRIPYNVREWKAVDVMGVPQFYLLKNGKVVGKQSGWPTEGNKAALLALLEAAPD